MSAPAHRDLFDVRSRVAVITGAASGLGRAFALELAARGAQVFGLDLNEAGLAATVQEIQSAGGAGAGFRCDLEHPEQIRAAFREVDRVFGRVDVLINNAFTAHRSAPEELSLADWHRVMNVNLTGAFLCAQEAGRRMIALQNGGSIINISSIAGSTALGRGNFVYSISKGGLNQMTRELAVEWARHRIRVNAIQPCQTQTPPVAAWLESAGPDLMPRLLSGIPMNRLAETGDFIGAVIFLASEASAMVTGSLLPVDGGNLALNAGGSHRPV